MVLRRFFAFAVAGLSLTVAVSCATGQPGSTDSSKTSGPPPTSTEGSTTTSAVSSRPPHLDGLRKVVAVARFENRTGLAGQAAFNNAMADQLVDALIRSKQFTVLERQTVSDVMEEQDFANSGRVMKRQTARTGRIVAAQILIKGTITEYEGEASSSFRGADMGLFKIGSSKSKAHVGLMIRLIDSSTGEVIDSQRVEGSSSSGGLGFQIGVFGQQTKHKGPLDKAAQEAIDKSVMLIAARLASIPFETRVLRNLGGELVVAAGNMVGAQVGDEFDVFALGEEFVDPYTGESLGRDETAAGIVRITEVKEKYSKANPVGALGPVKAGDIVRARTRKIQPH